MPSNLKRYFSVNFLISIILLAMFFGCASIQQPTGGPKDTEPPKVLSESPKNFTLNFNSPEISIQLNEYFKLSNTAKEISLSPDVDKQPEYKIKKKYLHIRFQDTLEKNTTYTINFGNGIVDYNEGNILKNYSYVFSTGSKIDSLSITGTVTNAITKAPQLDATVFLLPANQDTLFGKKKAHIFTTTDSSGNFKLQYLKENTYRIYAVYEKDGGDKIYNSPNDEVAFIENPVILRKDTSGIKLHLFKEEPTVFRLLDRKIENTGRIIYTFNQKLETPSLQILSPAELNNEKIVEFSRNGDTALLWTKDLTFDSIKVAILNNGKPLDTTMIRRSKRDDYKQTIGIEDNIPTGRVKPGTDVVLSFSAPISTIDTKLVTLLQDSVPVRGFRFERDSVSTRKYRLKYSWRNEKSYDLTIADNAVKGTYGGLNKQFKKAITRDDEENYGNLNVHFTVPDTSKAYLIELLNASDQPITKTIINTNRTINYTMYSVGKYSIRITYDENKNGIWDTGSVKEKKQPEQIWNSPTEITLRANWDLEEKITIPPPSQ
ncbi:Ig-like domain-containing domain [Desertivirga xinjiangensis]|uniref:Ig-like domain-containing domain n=1 Tax=Desertivirga xinjiangensis TaxID=539206 RepID=UPI00210D2CD4|nr:Ig-like domain-containing domain [Pedobacter xinjiangensis]